MIQMSFFGVRAHSIEIFPDVNLSDVSESNCAIMKANHGMKQ